MRQTRLGRACWVIALGTTVWSEDPVSAFRAASWTPVATFAEFPEHITEALAARFGPDDPIAERGGEFEPTDVVSGAPSKRFVIGGQEDELWFVALEQGGYVHQLVLVVVRDGPDGASVTLVARGTAGHHGRASDGWSVTVDELRTALADGTLRVEDVSEERD